MEKELPKEVILNLDKLDSSYWASHPAKIAYKNGLTDGAIVAHSHHQLQLNAVVDHAAEIAKENDRLSFTIKELQDTNERLKGLLKENVTGLKSGIITHKIWLNSKHTEDAINWVWDKYKEQHNIK